MKNKIAVQIIITVHEKQNSSANNYILQYKKNKTAVKDNEKQLGQNDLY